MLRAASLALVVLAGTAASLPLPGVLCAPLGFGCEAWVHRYNGPGNGLDDAGAMALSPDGATAFVTGHSLSTATGFDVAVLAVDTATGAERWLARVDGGDGSTDEGRAVAVTPDGRTVVSAAYGEAGGDQDVLASAHDAATGARRWVTTYGRTPGGFDLGLALALSPGGDRAFVAGLSETGAGDWDATVVAFDVATGARAWVTAVGGPGQQRAHAAATSPDGRLVLVAGLAQEGPAGRLLTAALDAATGAEHWRAVDGGPADLGDADLDAHVALLPDGTVVAAATGLGPDGTLDVHLAARDAATGELRWTARYGAAGGAERPAALGAAPGGAVLVAGFTEPKDDPGRADYLVLAFDGATGALRWAARHDGLGRSTDRALALAVDPARGRAYVAGESFGTPAEAHVNPLNVGVGTGLDYGTVALDLASGAVLGAVQYDGANSVDRARAVGLAASGRVVVAGHSHGGETGFDYAVAAYDPAAWG